MTIRLIRTSSIDTPRLLLVDGRPVQQRYSALMRILAAHGLGDRFVLAEPIVTFPTETQPGQIAWYLDSAREPVPLDLLSPHPLRQARLHLEQLLPRLLLAASSDLTRSLHRALTLASASGILWMDGAVVVVDWGLAPQGNGEPLPPLELTPLFASLLPQGPAPILVPPPFAKERAPDAAWATVAEPRQHLDVGTASLIRVQLGPRRPMPLLLHLVTGLMFLLLGLATGLRLLGVPAAEVLRLGRHARVGGDA